VKVRKEKWAVQALHRAIGREAMVLSLIELEWVRRWAGDHVGQTHREEGRRDSNNDGTRKLIEATTRGEKARR
jgi:hypothetical protein